MVLVLDESQGDKVAHGCAGVPSNIVGIHVDFLQVSDHFALVGNVALGARGGSGSIARVALVAIGRGVLDGGEGKGVGDLQRSVLVHANEGSGRHGRED